MFTHFKNIDTAFQHIRRFTYLLIGVSALVVCFAVYESFRFADQAQQRIHILYNGKVMEAFAATRKAYLPVELRDHIRTFHQEFFTLLPDEKQIRGTVEKALYLADGSAKAAYDNLQEAGYYNNLISANINQQVSVDSITLDVNRYPYGFTCYATEQLIRATSITTRRLVTTGKVSDLKVETDDNPHGFLIQGWHILQNNDVSTKSKQP